MDHLIHTSLPINTANQLAHRTWSEAELRGLIFDVISSASAPKTTKKLPDFHTTKEIKETISLHIDDLRKQFGVNPFVPAAFRHALKQLTLLKKGDHVILSDGYSRWDTQVSDAMKTSRHIVRVKTGWYRLLTEQEMIGQGALPLED